MQSKLLILTTLALFLNACATETSTTRRAATQSSTAESSTTQTASKQPAVEVISDLDPTASTASREIVNNKDRTAEDRKTDQRRHPALLLDFMDLQPGARVADLGAGSGYTTELLVRAVGPSGKVYAQNNRHTLEKFVSKSWPARLARPVMHDVIRMDREFPDPLSTEASNLDAVTILFAYHDVVVAGEDRQAMLSKLHAALKDDGVVILADHDALPGSGLAAAKALHRLERAVVIEEFKNAGFDLVQEADFLRNPDDDHLTASYKIGFKTDRYVLKFKKHPQS